MTPKERADILAEKCTDAIIEAPEENHTNDIIRETCCLMEFFEVVEKSHVVLQHCDTTTTGIFELQDALTALRAKLPKEMQT